MGRDPPMPSPSMPSPSVPWTWSWLRERRFPLRVASREGSEWSRLSLPPLRYQSHPLSRARLSPLSAIRSLSRAPPFSRAPLSGGRRPPLFGDPMRLPNMAGGRRPRAQDQQLHARGGRAVRLRLRARGAAGPRRRRARGALAGGQGLRQLLAVPAVLEAGRGALLHLLPSLRWHALPKVAPRPAARCSAVTTARW
eukprot:7053784-Prymnesium_polylepis.1